jgi:DNA ligase (NAD+)
VACDVGVVVPVAILMPIDISGVTISRASLHNTHLPSTLDLHVGDTVVIERRGDVIPQVASVVTEKRPKGARPWVPPTHCPACNMPLQHRKTESSKDSIQLLECGNPMCSGRKVRRLERFAEVAIKGVGKKVVQLLANKGFVETPADFYGLAQHRETVWSFSPCNLPRIQHSPYVIHEQIEELNCL